MNSLEFLSTFSHELYYSTVEYVAKPVASVYKNRMDGILSVYKRGVFNITKIHCDSEFRKVMDPFLARQDLLIKINY